MRRLLLVLACVTSTIGAQPRAGSPKPAWDISDQERVERRFDAAASAARRARAVAEGHASPGGHDVSFYVLGRHNPELFMATELISKLLVVYAPETEVGRKFRDRWWQKGIDRFGSDFWSTFDEVTAPLVARETRMWRRAREVSAGRIAQAAVDSEDLSGTEVCLLRSKGLAAARERFGRDRIDAFLYEVIAPEVGEVTTSSTDPNGLRDLAMWVEGGCR